MIKAIRWVAIVGACWTVVESLPSVARYLRIRTM